MKKRRSFRHLSDFDRDRLEALLSSGHSQEEAAAVLKVDPSTVSRERGRRKRKDGRYDARAAARKAQVARSRSKYRGMKIERHQELKGEIIRELKKGRSPDEMAGRMKLEKRSLRVGTNAIYKWLYSPFGQQYCRYLCTRRVRKKKQRRKPAREMIPDRISLRDKPKTKGLVEMEGDTFLSPKRAGTTESAFLGSIKGTHLLVGTKLPRLSGEAMKAGFSRSTEGLEPDLAILDNGIENRGHKDFGVPCYFCDPHAPWQKPRVECDIGLLRRWFIPKGTNLESVSEGELQKYLHILNHKYRKSLGYRSAYEVSKKKGIIETIPEHPLEEKVAFH